MKTTSFAGRNLKEMVRDKLNLFFGLGFPLILLCLLTLIQSNIPVNLFALDSLTPGVALFGLSFIALFSGLLVAKDRTGSFILRLYTSPMTSWDFILGYTLPLLPMAILQMLFCFICAFALGLPPHPNALLTIVVLLPAAVVFISIGLLCGSLFTDKQVSALCGAVLTNVAAWLSGTWFDLDLVGGAFKAVADLLPFSHAVRAGRYALAGEYSRILPELLWVVGYAVALFLAAIWAFRKKRSSASTAVAVS